MSIQILTFTTVYPNAAAPALGGFVRRRMEAVAQLAPVRVVAPVPWLAWGRQTERPPRREVSSSIEVLHPRWLYPPRLSGLNPPLLSVFAVREVAALHRSHPFDVVDAHFAFPDGAAAALLARTLDVPYIVTLRGNEVDHARCTVRRRWIQWTLGGAARVIAVSERLRSFAVENGASPDKTHVIPNGIDAATFRPRDRAAVRARLGMTRPTVLSVGQLIELKGHHRIVRALAEAGPDAQAAELWIAGGQGHAASYESEIRAAISAVGFEKRVRFLGHLDPAQLSDHMAAADLLCLGSSREGWPNVISEALACGTPVVATDVGAVPEMLPSAEYGSIVPPGDIGAMRDALVRALRTNWNRAAIAAWGQSRSWEQVAAETLEQLRGAVSDYTSARRIAPPARPSP